MESSWIPSLIDGKEEWGKLDNRRTKLWSRLYTVRRDKAYRPLILDGRYGSLRNRSEIERFGYARPILVCHKQETNLVCTILIKLEKSRVLFGQNHQYEIAHDFTFSGDLNPGELFTRKARFVVQNIGSFPISVQEIDAMWDEFFEFFSDSKV